MGPRVAEACGKRSMSVLGKQASAAACKPCSIWASLAALWRPNLRPNLQFLPPPRRLRGPLQSRLYTPRLEVHRRRSPRAQTPIQKSLSYQDPQPAAGKSGSSSSWPSWSALESSLLTIFGWSTQVSISQVSRIRHNCDEVQLLTSTASFFASSSASASERSSSSDSECAPSQSSFSDLT